MPSEKKPTSGSEPPSKPSFDPSRRDRILREVSEHQRIEEELFPGIGKRREELRKKQNRRTS